MSLMSPRLAQLQARHAELTVKVDAAWDDNLAAQYHVKDLRALMKKKQMRRTPEVAIARALLKQQIATERKTRKIALALDAKLRKLEDAILAERDRLQDKLMDGLLGPSWRKPRKPNPSRRGR